MAATAESSSSDAKPLGEPWESVSTRPQWREWLARNHMDAPEAFVVIYKRGPYAARFTLGDAQEEALCFGWVDVRNQCIDEDRYALKFTPRRPSSQWSSSNIRRVERLLAQGLMAPAGLAVVDEAKRSGQWDLGLRVERTDEVPEDLRASLGLAPGVLDAYLALSHSRRRQILRSVLGARTAAGRARRVAAVVDELRASRHSSQ